MATINVIDRDGEESKFDAEAGVSVMENLKENDYDLEAICGGQCSCATCHVYVGDDWTEQVGGPSDEERELLEELESFKDTSRLSCQIELSDAVDGPTVRIAPEE